MLKGIPPVISPGLMKILMEMGHGDEIVIGDGNFPAASVVCKPERLARCDGHSVPELLSAILPLFPLDSYVECPVSLMDVVKGDNTPRPAIWETYEKIIKQHEPVHHGIEWLERFAFYTRAKEAYAVIATGEKAIYANIILKKGVVQF